MKNLKGIGLLLVALLLGAVAAFYASTWAKRMASHVASTKVVVAKSDIEQGTRIDPRMLTVVDWPTATVPQDAFRQVNGLQDRVVKTGILAGEPLLERKLAPVGAQGGLSALITPGKRAITVHVNEVIGVAGFALPGTYVDVVVNTQQGQPGNTSSISKTVLEHVLVLAAAQETTHDDTKPKVVNAVTLELSPADAEKLDVARSVGSLSLVLRNQVDKQTVTTTGTTKEQLLGEAGKMPASTINHPAPIQKATHADVRRPAAKAHRAAKTRPHGQDTRALAANCVEVVQEGTQELDCFGRK